MEAGALREGGDAEEDAHEGDALHADLEVSSGAVAAGDRGGVERRDPDPAGQDLGPARGWNGRPDRFGVRQGRLEEDVAAVRETGARGPPGERRNVVERDGFDLLGLGMGPD